MSVTLFPAEGVRLVKNILIPVQDGVRLAADLYLPDTPTLPGHIWWS